MKKGLLTLFISLFLLVGCHSNDNKTVKYIEVAPEMVDCEGVAPMRCLLVKEVNQDKWQLYYDTIDGFEFEPGYRYKLKVSVSNKSRNIPTPADASTISWALLEILNKSAVQ